MVRFKLSPSDFGFLWEECRRCFWLKVAGKFPRPRAPFPKIFQAIDGIMKEYFEGKDASEISPNLPPGTIEFGEREVESEPFSPPGTRAKCFISGKFDTAIAFRDGGYGVVDFKTSDVKADNVGKYSRQLHAYAWALEHPAPSKPNLSPVKRLGLLVAEPVAMRKEGKGGYLYEVRSAWTECRKDYGGFLEFLGEVVRVIERPDPPAADPKCVWCAYRAEAAKRGG